MLLYFIKKNQQYYSTWKACKDSEPDSGTLQPHCPDWIIFHYCYLLQSVKHVLKNCFTPLVLQSKTQMQKAPKIQSFFKT